MSTIVSAFGVDHVTRITGLTPRQLAYWDKIGLFRPAHARLDAGAKAVKIYSFKDMVGLRVIAVLRKQHKISVQALRKVATELAKYGDAPWSTLKLVVCKGEVGLHDPATGRASGIFSGQGILVPLIDQIRHVRDAAAALNTRLPDEIGATEKHRNVVQNVRVFAGTRVPVRAVERFLDAGYSASAILKEYPRLKIADIELVERERRKRAA